MARYLAGYEAGRTTCLRAGSSDAAHSWLKENHSLAGAYVAGFEWAVWDYEDANGMLHQAAGTRPLPGERRSRRA